MLARTRLKALGIRREYLSLAQSNPRQFMALVADQNLCPDNFPSDVWTTTTEAIETAQFCQYPNQTRQLTMLAQMAGNLVSRKSSLDFAQNLT